MLVVVIIGMLVGIAAVKIGGQSVKARLVATQRQIDAYKTALGLYELENGFYPSSEQGLQSLITQPTTPPVAAQLERSLPRPGDCEAGPVATRLHLQVSGYAHPSGYDLYSLGPTGVEGDPGNIGNWQ